MARFTIYSNDGNTERYSGTPKYSGSFGKVSYIEYVEIKSPSPIAFEVGDYVDYRGYRYSLYSIPQPEKHSSANTYGAAFIYKNVKLESKTKELELTLFRDIVLNDNNIHYTSLPDVSTYEDIYGIANRIQANLNGQYGIGEWEIRVQEVTGDLLELFRTPIAFTLSNGTCLGALNLIYNTWKYENIGVGWIYTVENGANVITIGRASVRDNANQTSLFLYGKGNGLRIIKKEISSNTDIATRLFVYGNTTNMPARYYNNIVPNIKDNVSVYLPNLMLPFSAWGDTDGLKDARLAYVEDAEAISKWGLRSKCIYFDGSGDYEDIYPSIEGMTIGEIRAAKTESGETDAGKPDYFPSTAIYHDNYERVDKIKSAVNPSDNGVESTDGNAYIKKLSVSQSAVTINEAKQPDADDLISTSVDSFSIDILQASVDIDSYVTFADTSDIIGIIRTQGSPFTIQCSWSILVNDVKVAEKSQVDDNGNDKIYASSLNLSIPDMNATVNSGDIIKIRLQVYVYYYVRDGYSIDGNIYAKNYEWGCYNKKDSPLSVTIKQIGFNIPDRKSNLDSGLGTISMRDGFCAGRNFVITACYYNASTDDYTLTIAREEDKELGQTFPNSLFPINGRTDDDGNVIQDQFVILDIEMPALYVKATSQRLLNRANELLSYHTKQLNVYSPEIDNIQMQRWEDGNSGRTIREGMYFCLSDLDLESVSTPIYVLIDTVTIDESAAVPQYSVTLRDDKRISRKDREQKAAAKRTETERAIISDGEREPLVKSGATNYNSTPSYYDQLLSLPTIDEHKIRGNMLGYDDLGLINSTLIERVNNGTEESPDYHLLSKYDLYIYSDSNSATSVNISEILRHLFLRTEDGITYLGTDLNFFSEQDSAAGGIGSGAGGGGGTAYDRLDAWADYDLTKAGWVLSALLGNDLNTRLSAIESETMSLSSLTDVDTTGAANGKVLTYNSTSHTWTPQSVATSLATLTDVSISGVSDGQYLYYDSSAAKWKAKSLTSVFQMKGVVATIADLPIGSNIVGDVWHVAENGSEYVYLTSGWEELGTTIDLSGYLPKSAGSTQALSGDLYVEGYKTGALTTLASIAVISATRTSGTESVVTWGDEGVVSHLAGSSIIADTDISIIQSGTTLKNISEILRHLYLQTTDGITYLGTDLNFFSEQDSAAGGIGSGAGGGGGTAYDRLDAWADYDSDKAGWVLSALLGNDLNSRVGTIEDNYTRPSGSSNPIKYLEVVSDYPATETADTLYLKTGITANSFTLTVFEWSEIGTYAGSESQDEVFSAYAFKQLYDIVQGFTGGEWGSVTANYVPLTIGEVTQNLSIDGHTHSQYALSSTLYNYITTNSAFSNFLSRSLASTGSGNAIVGLSVASDAVTGGYKLQATKGSVGTVTSVGISVPTGLAVSGSPITSSGTIAIALASGYSIPTTAKQTNWDTAYSNYHTHGNKSVLDGITSTKVGNWDTAFSNSHTHDNKSVLDGITSTKVSSWDTAYSNYHAHSTSYSFAANQITCNSIVIGGVTVSVVSGALRVTGNFAASGGVAAGA